MELKDNSTKTNAEKIVASDTDKKVLKIGDSTNEVKCAVCGTTNARKCSKCKTIAYCGRDCQSKDWPTHRLSCKSSQQKQVNKDNKRGLSAKPTTVTDGSRTDISEITQSPNTGSLLGSGAANASCSAPGNSRANQSNATKGDKVGAESTRGTEDVIDIATILSDQSILNDFLDPEIDRALKDIKKDPLNIENYKDSKKLKSLIEKVTKKLDLGAQKISEQTT